MVEAFTSPMIAFQFQTTSKDDEERMIRWIRMESDETERTGWDQIGKLIKHDRPLLKTYLNRRSR